MNKFFPALFLLLMACTQATRIVDDVPLITFDITKESDWTADSIECKFIPLETKDECLLATLVDVQFYKDKIFILDGYQKGQVMVFSLEGKFITRIGQTGDGPGDYLMPQKIHIDAQRNRITIVDIRLNRLIHYRLDDFKYISYQNAFNHADCIWLADGNILWYNCIGFDTGKREHYFVYITNANLEEIAYWGKTEELSPYMVAEHALFQHDKQTYISFPFSPMIYRVSSEKLEPVTELSFGKQILPPDDYIAVMVKDGIQGSERMMKSDYVNSYTAYETPEYMAVTYYSRNFDSYLGFYNKKTKETHSFSMEMFAKRFGVIGGKLILRRNDDCFVMPLYAKRLKKQQTFREDLNQISENMTEEDNPVLCLFKFK